MNQISVDEEGEVMACCSDDGKVSNIYILYIVILILRCEIQVIIVGLFTSKYNNSVQFDKAIKVRYYDVMMIS